MKGVKAWLAMILILSKQKTSGLTATSGLVSPAGSFNEPALCPPPSVGGLKRAFSLGDKAMPALVAPPGVTEVVQCNLREPVTQASFGSPASPCGLAGLPWEPARPRLVQATVSGAPSVVCSQPAVSLPDTFEPGCSLQQQEYLLRGPPGTQGPTCMAAIVSPPPGLHTVNPGFPGLPR